MLSSDALSQLSSLKQEIRANKDTAQGTVRGTSGRYGFVSLDDGRDAFLKPEQMDRVLHGDRIEVAVKQNDKEQYEATIEKLLFSPQKQVAGRYCIKGKGHFVVYQNQQHSRWIFVPPKARNNAKDGHYVVARISQHPFETGKVQARIISDIGNIDHVDTLRQFTLASFQLYETFPADVREQAKQLENQPIALTDGRQDLRHLDFVTIDAASTRDMDDALCIEAIDNGWRLHVAIADPGSEIAAESPLDTIAMRRGHSLYLPGKVVPMLPEALSVERYSLVANRDRLALVCSLDITAKGKVTQCQFESALISSKAKLSYQQVSAQLAGEQFEVVPPLSDATPFVEQLQTLKACSEALLAYRKQYHLVSDSRADFMLIINEQGKLGAIEKIERTAAHSIVEEAMVATNRAAGDFLAQHQNGLFMHHPGYREERREDIEKLLAETLEQVGDTRQLENYIKVVQTLQHNPEHQNLLAIQQRFNQGSEPTTEPLAHFGLGIQYYATVTSPIRRYQDLYNQRAIHRILAKQKREKLRNKQVERLQEAIANNRSAARAMEQWLVAEYMQQHVGQIYTGYIALLTNQGVGIRLDDTGIEGFILARKEDKNSPEADYDKLSFNNQRMELTWNGNELRLEQPVTIKVDSVDMERKKVAFAWAEPL